MSLGTDNWTTATRERVREVQDNLLAAAAWAAASQADPTATEMLLQPYRQLLDNIYERDLPLAKLADQSDLLLHVHGPAASGPAPRVSVLTRILTQTRDQVTRLAKQLGGVTTLRVPAALDMGLVGIASGSLFVGFSAADSTGESAITWQAVEAIAIASDLIAHDADAKELARSLPDPAARDMAVAAVRQLSPSGQLGISAVELLGRRVARATSLTTDTRRHARVLMTQPAAPITEHATFIGTVREVDLDASRFEIRNVEGHPEDIRCAHELEEEMVKRLVDRRVRVSGAPEFGPNHTVRLLWVNEVELLG
jgi:hypothetical protein